MSVWDDVFDGLNSMRLPQLLLAFVAGMAYMLAQGELAPRRIRRVAAGVALGAAIFFVLLGEGWERNTMLVVLAVAGIGGFIGLTWTLARLLGLAREPGGWSEAASGADLGAATSVPSTSSSTRPAALHTSAPVRTGGPTAVG